MNCPRCRKKMMFLRSISNTAKQVSWWGHELHVSCQAVLLSLGNPLMFLSFTEFSRWPSSPFATSLSHAKVGVKKRDLRSADFHARQIRRDKM